MSVASGRAVVKYPGAKWRIADWIISKMPQHKSYLEPFFGSGAIFFKKSPAPIETINDIDSEIYNLFTTIRNYPEELCRQIEMTPFSRQEYFAAFNPGGDEIERARKYLVKCWQGHGFRICYKSGWKNDIAGREKAYAVKY
ncbi:MAG: DNA adenine methylase [Bacillota bacterium]